MRAVVIALGKIGLPLAAKIALAGHEVVGCDIDPRVVELVNSAREPFPGEAGLARALDELVPAGRLRASTDTRAAVAGGPDLIVAVPPLAVDAEAKPDFTILDAVIEEVGAALRPGAVVSIETTIPVGTTRNRIAPKLAELSGLEPEREFFTVHSPERVYSGRIFQDLDTYPKLVGGLSELGERRAADLYASFLTRVEVRAMGSAEAAELTKLAETTYRDVNIALANEFAVFADRLGIDLEAVIDAANSQPFSHIHHPGIAVGGHCIPVYPRFYLEGDRDAKLPAASRSINDAMPRYAVDRLDQRLGRPLAGATVLILGITYRGNVKETAFSGAFGVRDELAVRGAIPVAADPLYEPEELRAAGFTPWQGERLDAVIVQADHESYRSLDPAEFEPARVVLDGRGVLDAERWRAAGIGVIRIGRPEQE
ncbi:MAG: nucleotide sugar dehydrogenase [Solirubrobacteraceae bacterium]